MRVKRGEGEVKWGRLGSTSSATPMTEAPSELKSEKAHIPASQRRRVTLMWAALRSNVARKCIPWLQANTTGRIDRPSEI